MIPATFHPTAQADYAAAVAGYPAGRSGVRGQFRAAFRAAVRRIRRFPRMYAAEPNGERVCPVDGFPYQLVYHDFGTHVWIACVNHEGRRPGHWAARRPDDA